MKIRKLLCVFLSIVICFSVCFVGIVNVFAVSTTYNIEELEGRYKTQGRTTVKDGMLMIENSASGIEFTADCSGNVSIELEATRVSGTTAKHGIYFSVFVDGVMQYSDLRIPADNNAENWVSNSTNYPFYMPSVGKYTFEIAENLEKGNHTFEIYTQTPANRGAFGINSITLDGTILEAPEKKDMLIEIVGDSIAVGHGNLASGGKTEDNPLYIDATRGWGFLAAKQLDADWSIIGKSGIAATPGLNYGGISSGQPSITDIYPYSNYYSENREQYSFERNADVIVVSLGTNDIWLYQDSSLGYNLTDADLKQGFKATLTQLRSKNPDAKIVWVYGMMISEANEIIKSAVAEMGGEKNNFYSLALAKNTSGGQSHPDLAAQTDYADTIAEFIDSISDKKEIWDGVIPSAPLALDGDGTEESPYKVTSGNELASAIKFAQQGKYYQLQNDIYLNDIDVIDWATGMLKDGYAESTENMWDGVVPATALKLKGNGTKESPYRITNGNELASAIKFAEAGKYYALQNDIYLNDINAIDWTDGTLNEGYEDYVINSWFDSSVASKCQGNFLGNGHIVYGLYFNDTSAYKGYDTSYVGGGLFPKVSKNCTLNISQLGIDYAYVRDNYAGAFVGTVGDDPGATETVFSYLNVSECYTGLNVKVVGYNAADFVANIRAGQVQLDNVYSLSTTVGQSRAKGSGSNKYYWTANGMIGELWTNGTVAVYYAYSLNGPISARNIPSISAVHSGATYDAKTCITTGLARNSEQLQGLDALSLTDKLSRLNNGKFVATETYPMLSAFVREESGEKEIYNIRHWFDSSVAANCQGTFLGNGYVVYGLYYNDDSIFVGYDTSYAGAGLFPKVGKDCTLTVSQLGIDYAYVRDNYAGAFVGTVGADPGATEIVFSYLNVSECYTGLNVTVEGYNAADFVANIRAGQVKLENVYSLSTTAGQSRSAGSGSNKYYWTANGMIGELWTSGTVSVTGAYSLNGPISARNIPIISAIHSGAKYDAKSCITTGLARTPEQMQGLDALTLTDKLSRLNNGKFTATETYPVLTVFVKETEDDNEGNVSTEGVWDGVVPSTPLELEGKGTKRSPYEITNGNELASAIKFAEAGKYYELKNDIYLNNIDAINWTNGTLNNGFKTYEIRSWFDSSVAGTCQGTFLGNGYVVYGLYYKDTSAYKGYDTSYVGGGLFPKVGKYCTLDISQLGIDYAYVRDNYAGAFVGTVGDDPGATESVLSYLNVSECYTGLNVTVEGYNAADFVANIRAGEVKLENVYSLATTVGQPRSAGSGSNKYEWTAYGMIGEIWTSGIVSVSKAYSVKGPISARNIANVSSIYSGAQYHWQSCITTGLFRTPEQMQGLDTLALKEKLGNLNNGKFVAKVTYPVLEIFLNPSSGEDMDFEVEKPGEVWNGTVAPDFIDESIGTEEDPIIISSPSELALAISKTDGKYYKLSCDLYLNDVSNKKWHMASGVKKWQTGTTFNGHIDGDGYIVYGLYYPSDNTKDAALIPQMTGGSVKNLGVRYANVTTSGYGAGIIGTVSGEPVMVENCFVDESVSIYGKAAGGIVGYNKYFAPESNKGLTIKNCYSKAMVSASKAYNANGLLGNSWRSAYEIYGGYTTGSAPYNAKQNDGFRSSAFWFYTDATGTKPAVSYQKENTNVNDYFKNVYTSYIAPEGVEVWNYVPTKNMYGDAVATGMPELDWNVFVQSQDTPILKIFADRGYDGIEQDFSSEADIFSGGRGTEIRPYLITTVAQLRYLVNSTNTYGKYYRLANDIYVNDTTKSNWMNKKPEKWYSLTNAEATEKNLFFRGTLDGNGYTIYGLYYNDKPLKEGSETSLGGTGLFPYVNEGAKIINLHIRDSYISGKAIVGAFVGQTNDSGSKYVTLVGCSVDDSVQIKGQCAGGLIGGGTGLFNISYCYSKARITHTGLDRQIGQLVGDVWLSGSSASNCYAVGVQPFNPNFLPACQAVYATTKQFGVKVITANKIVGASAKDAMPKLDWDVFYIVNGNTPHTKVLPIDFEYTGNSGEGVKGQPWSGNVATKFAGGSGTQTDPYLIETPEQLAYLLRKTVSQANTYYKLTADIILNDTSSPNWMDEANEWFSGEIIFKGHFDGNGHVVSGLYYNTEDTRNCGLFPMITANASISRLGVVDSHIVNLKVYSTSDISAGAIVGQIYNWDGINSHPKTQTKTPPIFSQCFVAEDVYIESAMTGGIVGCGSSATRFENCYSLANIIASTRGGGLFGHFWENEPVMVENCYVATPNRLRVGLGISSTSGDARFTNVYVDGQTSGNNGAEALSLIWMRGNEARKNMKGLDFENIWKVVDGGTPVLRVFANAEKYTTKRDPQKVSVSFVTSGGTECEPIYGYPRYTELTEDMLPTPTRYGYKFAGWYYFDYHKVAFESGTFPDYDTILYAKWEEMGFEVDFENRLDPNYDINSGAEEFRPGTIGYNPAYVHGGLGSLHCKGDSTINPTFLLSYHNKLEVGREYEMTFYMYAKTVGDPGSIELLFTEYPDVLGKSMGKEFLWAVETVKEGKWIKYTVKFIAQAPYAMVQTPVGSDLFFDDIMVVPIGEAVDTEIQKEPGGFNPIEILSGENGLPVLLIIIGICAVVLLTVGAIIVIVIVKKHKKAK